MLSKNQLTPKQAQTSFDSTLQVVDDDSCFIETVIESLSVIPDKRALYYRDYIILSRTTLLETKNGQKKRKKYVKVALMRGRLSDNTKTC